MRKHIVRHNVQNFARFQLWCDRQNDTWSQILEVSDYAENIERFINSSKEEQPGISRFAEDEDIFITPSAGERNSGYCGAHSQKRNNHFGGFHE